MSDLASYSVVVTAATGPSLSAASGSTKGSAAFSGVLERIAAQTASDRPAAPTVPISTRADPGGTRAQAPDSESAEATSGSDKEDDAAPSGRQAPDPTTVVDISALAQAALGPLPVAVTTTGPQPAAAATGAPQPGAATSAALPISAPSSGGAGPAQTTSGTETRPGRATSDPVGGKSASPAAVATVPQPTTPLVATQAIPAEAPLTSNAPAKSAASESGTPAAVIAASPQTAGPASSSNGLAQNARGAGSLQSEQRTALASQTSSTATGTPVGPKSASGSTRPVLPSLTPAGSSSAASTATAGVSPPPVLATTPDGSGSSGQGTSGEKAKGKTDLSSAASATSTTPSSEIAAVQPDIPAPPASPAQQIVTALQSLGLKSVTAARQSPPTAAIGLATPAVPAASVKTLTIELNPAHLGPVSITMRMQADGVDIRIAVSNPETLQLLDRDKHVLSAAVEAAGGSRDALQIAGLSPNTGFTDQGSGGQSYSQHQPGRHDGFSSDASSSGGQAQNQGQPAPSNLTQSDDDDTMPTLAPAAPIGLDGSLYL